MRVEIARRGHALLLLAVDVIKAGAPELGKVLEEASSFLNEVLGGRDYVFCANDACDFVAPLLGRLGDGLGCYGFSSAPWVALSTVAHLVAPARERRSTDGRGPRGGAVGHRRVSECVCAFDARSEFVQKGRDGTSLDLGGVGAL